VKKRVVVIAALLMMGLFLGQNVQANVRLAVSEFQDLTNARIRGLGASFSEQLTSALAKTRRFEVIERSQLDNILREQHFSNMGLVDPATAAEIGKIIGLNYMVIGNITDLSAETNSVRIPLQGAVSQTKMQLTVNFRLVNTETAAIETADALTVEESALGFQLDSRDLGEISLGTDSPTTALLKKVIEKAVAAIVDKISENIALEGIVILTRDTGEVMIDLGRTQGVVQGMRFLIYRASEPIKHPVTGEILGVITEDVGELEIISVQDRLSTARIIELKDKINIGDSVKLINQTVNNASRNMVQNNRPQRQSTVTAEPVRREQQASQTASEKKLTPYFQLTTGTYDMKDINTFIDFINIEMSDIGFRPMKKIKGGISYEGGLNIPLNARTSLRLGLQRYSVKRQARAEYYDYDFGYQTITVTVNTSATGGVVKMVLNAADNLRLYVGGGFYSSGYSMSVSSMGLTVEGETLMTSGFGYEGGLEFSHSLSERLQVSGGVGFAHLKNKLADSSIYPISIYNDFSGLRASVAVSLSL